MHYTHDPEVRRDGGPVPCGLDPGAGRRAEYRSTTVTVGLAVCSPRTRPSATPRTTNLPNLPTDPMVRTYQEPPMNS